MIAPGRWKKEDLGCALERWEELAARSERRKGADGNREDPVEVVKIAARESPLPKELGDHVVLNQARRATSREFRRGISAYVAARTGVWIRDALALIQKQREPRNPDDMDMGAIGHIRGSRNGGPGAVKGKAGRAERR